MIVSKSIGRKSNTNGTWWSKNQCNDSSLPQLETTLLKWHWNFIELFFILWFWLFSQSQISEGLNSFICSFFLLHLQPFLTLINPTLDWKTRYLIHLVVFNDNYFKEVVRLLVLFNTKLIHLILIFLLRLYSNSSFCVGEIILVFIKYRIS